MQNWAYDATRLYDEMPSSGKFWLGFLRLYSVDKGTFLLLGHCGLDMAVLTILLDT